MTRFLPKGFYTGAVKTDPDKKKEDLGLLLSSVPCTVAAMYTSNKVQAAPLKLNQKHLENHSAIGVIANSGNANAAALHGELHALEMAQKTAKSFGLKEEDVLVASTGVIGKELEIEPIEKAIETLRLEESEDSFARAIMTTDTVEKKAREVITIDGKEVVISGICKGSGMIHPGFATMLCFITTDIDIDYPLLQKALEKAVKNSFNRIDVDGDMSTNDMVLCFANALAGNEKITTKDENYRIFKKALKKLCKKLARKMAADGEGASRLIVCKVKGALSKKQAVELARSVVSSTLFKAAINGQDANWGRVICALGYAGVDFDPAKVDISFQSEYGKIALCKDGIGLDFNEEKAARIMSAKEITVVVNLHLGKKKALCYGCDLSHEYVSINADYRS